MPTHIVRETKHNLRCAVPPCSNILRHQPEVRDAPARRGTSSGRITACQSEVANLKLAICIDEQIARLQVAVKHVRRVDVFKSAKSLIEEGLEMSVRERLAGSDLIAEILKTCSLALGR